MPQAASALRGWPLPRDGRWVTGSELQSHDWEANRFQAKPEYSQEDKAYRYLNRNRTSNLSLIGLGFPWETEF